MWIADQWKDYEVIDCSKGEKLERWGKYLLVHSDPQVIWDTPKTERGWKHMNGHYHRSKKVLNLFAYTGGATLTAAAAGASVTHVDASKGMVAWSKENVASSGLSDKPIGSLL